MSEIINFYTNKNILITGPTDFLGVCLIEKVLRSIPDINKIYLLSKQKNFEKLIENNVFEKLLSTRTDEVFKKLVLVSGDVCDDNLGLNDRDKKLLRDDVQVVFHCAATSDFDDDNKLAIIKNLQGTRRVMELCKQMNRLEAMIYVSSIHANSFRTSSEEILYPPPGDADDFIRMAQESSLESLEILLGGHPNLNTFSKHLAEHEVARCALKISCAIVRPSIITAAWKEPIPGWTISEEGPQGFVKGVSLGTTRRVLETNSHMKVDYVPVDVVANQVLIAGYKAGKDRGPLLIYHCITSPLNPFNWRKYGGNILATIRKYPSVKGKWFPNIKVLPNINLYKISEFYAHFLSAIIFDLVGLFMGKQPIFLSKQLALSKFVDRNHKLMSTEFTYDNTKIMQLNENLNDEDKEIFSIDSTTLDWDDYFKKLILGVRKYLNNESIDTLEEARSKQKFFYALDIALKAFRMGTMWYLISCIFGSKMVSFIWLMPVFYVVFTYF